MVRDAVPSLKLVAYERVSTARQGRSGLGLEAQRKAIDDFAASKGAQVLARLTEVESGRRKDRPELEAALNLAKITGATLEIAKLDRLSRNTAFLLTLQGSGVRVLACDMPEANDLTVCSSDGVRGRGAPVANLSHNASFHSRERIAPSNHGIKHLGSIFGPRSGVNEPAL